MFVPAGRDIVRPGYALMPGDAPIMKAMKPHSARAVKFTWGVWGVGSAVRRERGVWSVSGVKAESEGRVGDACIGLVRRR